MTDLNDARVDAAAKVLYEYGCYGLRTWADHATTSAQDNYREKVTAVLAAADAVVTVEMLARTLYLADSLATTQDAEEWDAGTVDTAQRNAYLHMARDVHALLRGGAAR